MRRFVHMIALAAFLTVGFGVPMTFANEPAPAEQKEKKDMAGTKADPTPAEQKDKKDTAGSKADDEKKSEKKEMGGK
jgi:hypothetical protein